MKKYLLPAFLLISGIASAQCSDLFFSEYLEGSSNNKAIEIYNPTSAPINLNDYKIYRSNNGSPVWQDSLAMQGVIAPGGVYVAGNPSADPLILAVSDTLHTVTFFNGDDCLGLYHISTNTFIDMIGQLGVDPGTNWPVGSGATSEFTLVRMVGVQQGNTNWAVAATEYDVNPQNTFSFLGSHTMTPCCIVPSIQLLTQVDVACFGDSNGVIQVNASGTGPITYSWINRSETTPFLNNVGAGTYFVVASGACGNDTLAVTINQPAQLTQTLNVMTPSACNNFTGALDISASGGTSPYTYQWSNGATTPIINNLSPAVYSCTVTCSNGCTSAALYTVQSSPAPTPTFVFSIDTLCQIDPGSYQLIGSPAGGTWSGSGVIGSDFHPSAAGVGMHTITYTYADSLGCTGTAIDSVYVEFCIGIVEGNESDVQIMPNPVIDVLTLQFASANNAISIFNMQGQHVYSEKALGTSARISVTELPAGVYTVQVVNENGVVTKKILKQ